MSGSRDFGEIYKVFLRQCSRYTFPDPWGRLAGRSNFRSPPVDPPATLDSLLQRFEEKDLQEAGIAVMENDELVLTPRVYAGNTVIMPMRGDRQSG